MMQVTSLLRTTILGSLICSDCRKSLCSLSTQSAVCSSKQGTVCSEKVLGPHLASIPLVSSSGLNSRGRLG